MKKIIFKSLLLIVAFTFFASCKKDKEPEVIPTVSFLTVNNIGPITHDTTIRVKSEISIVTGEPEVSVSGVITYDGEFYVTINRLNGAHLKTGDEFCSNGSCRTGDGNPTEDIPLNIDASTGWDAHVSLKADAPSATYTYEYVFNSKGKNPIKLTVICDFTQQQ